MVLTNHYLVNIISGQRFLLSSFTVGNIVDCVRDEWILISETRKIVFDKDGRWFEIAVDN